ncbi:unnamed protein product, partial [Aphanomyces euteiches]
ARMVDCWLDVADLEGLRMVRLFWCSFAASIWLLLVFAHVFVDEWLISLWCPFGVASSITIGVNQLDSWVQELVLCEGDIHREDYFVLIQVVYFVT